MNYLKVYRKLMEKARSENRCKKSTPNCYERHHVVPECMFKDRKRQGPKGHLDGNPDDPANMVLLTYREHILAHILLCKIHKGSHYEFSMYSALLLLTAGTKSDKTALATRKSLGNYIKNSKLYAKYRIDARKVISKHRKGTMPCIDAVTRQPVGSHSINHENVKSGKWVHHSKGKQLSKERIQKLRSLSTGKSNPRFSGISNEEFLNEYILLSLKIGKIPSFIFFRKYYFAKYAVEFPKSLSTYRFNKGKDLFPIIEQKTGLIYDKRQKWSVNLNPQDFI